MDAEPRIDPDRLFAQRGWILRLAEGLVGKADADDLAQDALIAALEKPPRRETALRPWLRSVVRNLGAQWRRGEGRRARRQEAVARAERLPATDALVERAELQRMLAEEVVRLGEPQKTVVLLRYFEGLSSAEIARRTGAPAATVRSHLARGLERMRRRLDERHGGRSVWSAALLDLTQGVRTSLPPAPLVPHGWPELWKGLIAMKGIALVSGAVAVSAAVGLWFVNRAPAPVATEIAAITPSSAPELAPPTPPAVPVLAAERREANAVATPPSGDASGVEASSPDGRVTARILDPDGRALAGAILELVDGEESAESDAGGTVTLALEPGRELALRARHPQYADVVEHAIPLAGEVVHLGELRLPHAGLVRGWVRDETGTPVPGARVLVAGLEGERRDPEELRRHGPLTDASTPSTLADAEGRFQVRAPVGTARIWAGSDGLAWTSAGPLGGRTGPAAEDVLLELQPLRADDRIEGLVLAPDGAPVEGAGVSYFYRSAHGGSSGNARTGPDGRFSILVKQRTPHRIWIGDPQDRWARVVLGSVEPGVKDLVIAFEEPRWIDIRVETAEGEPVERFAAFAENADDDWHGSSEFIRDEEHADGHAQMRVPTHPFHARIEPQGFEVSTQGPFDPASPPAALTFVVEPRPGIRGRVVTASGEPVPGAEVELLPVQSFQVLVHGFHTRVERQWRNQVTTDANGEFVQYVTEENDYVTHYALRTVVDGYAPCILDGIELDPETGASGLELVLGPGGVIEGRVLAARGRDAAGVILGFNNAMGFPFTLRTDEDGTFRVERLAPGPWEIRPVEAEIDPERFTASYGPDLPPIDWTCDVFEGETTFVELDLRDETPCALAGSLELGGASLEGWSVSLEQTRQTHGSQEIVSAEPLAANGTFRIETRDPGTYTLVLHGPQSDTGRLVLSEELVLERGSAPGSSPSRRAGSSSREPSRRRAPSASTSTAGRTRRRDARSRACFGWSRMPRAPSLR